MLRILAIAFVSVRLASCSALSGENVGIFVDLDESVSVHTDGAHESAHTVDSMQSIERSLMRREETRESDRTSLGPVRGPVDRELFQLTAELPRASLAATEAAKTEPRIFDSTGIEPTIHLEPSTEEVATIAGTDDDVPPHMANATVRFTVGDKKPVTLISGALRWAAKVTSCMDVVNGILENVGPGTLQMWDCRYGGSNRQRFFFPANGLGPIRWNANPEDPESVDRCVTVATEKLKLPDLLLDQVQNASVQNGMDVQLDRCLAGTDGKSNQTFKVPVGGDDAQIIWDGSFNDNVKDSSRMCLDVNDGADYMGNNLQVWHCGTDASLVNQKFLVQGWDLATSTTITTPPTTSDATPAQQLAGKVWQGIISSSGANKSAELKMASGTAKVSGNIPDGTNKSAELKMVSENAKASVNATPAQDGQEATRETAKSAPSNTTKVSNQTAPIAGTKKAIAVPTDALNKTAIDVSTVALNKTSKLATNGTMRPGEKGQPGLPGATGTTGKHGMPGRRAPEELTMGSDYASRNMLAVCLLGNVLISASLFCAVRLLLRDLKRRVFLESAVAEHIRVWGKNPVA